jgi:hypothetical protein
VNRIAIRRDPDRERRTPGEAPGVRDEREVFRPGSLATEDEWFIAE